MNWRREWYKLALLLGGSLLLYFLPPWVPRSGNPGAEAIGLAHNYAREHVLTCLVPAFFIAGAISTFLNQAAVIRYLGPQASRAGAYGVAAVSGSILSVCSCTVLPMFAGIYRMGAGLGPASTFLFAGPAISVLAMVLTAQVLGWELGLARTVAAVALSMVVGLAMHVIFRRSDRARTDAMAMAPVDAGPTRPLWQTAVFFACLVGILVFGNWGCGGGGVWPIVCHNRWYIASGFAAMLAVGLVRWFGMPHWKVLLLAAATAAAGLLFWGRPLVAFAVGAVGLAAATASEKGAAGEWFAASWQMTKQIAPLLLLGVLAAGLLLGQPGGEGLISGKYIRALVGNDPRDFLAMSGLGDHSAAAATVRTVWPVWTNLFAAIFGVFMYFATLTEVPIIQGLLGSGMADGPALALLLAGPALSLPSMLVIRSVIGTRKTVVYVLLVIIASATAGLGFDLIGG